MQTNRESAQKLMDFSPSIAPVFGRHWHLVFIANPQRAIRYNLCRVWQVTPHPKTELPPVAGFGLLH
ncbi:MAG: hypothetical protein NWR30_00005 [Salibacteraceae bacterium]|nr:hypothetical protein [Salibacteraceae bacterium]